MAQRIILFCYVAATIAVGLWSKKKASDSKAFDGVNLGLLLCVMAGAGEWLGGTATTGVSEYGYIYGISGAWYTVANALGICFLAIFFAKLFRSLEVPTVSGIIGNYIGRKARVVSSIMLIFIMLTVGTSQMVSIGTLGQTLFGFDAVSAVVILGSGIILYTIFGGMMAVGYTNIMHMIIMYGGAIIALVVCSMDIGGLEGLEAALPESYFSVTSIGGSKVSSWLIASVLGACTAQAGLQPILGAKDEKTAAKSSFLIALLVAPFGILTALLGMIAKVKFPELENAKLALPTLLLSLQPVMGGFVMSSIFAAVLSTASPIFLACGTLFTRDVYSEFKFSKKGDSDKATLRVSRMATFCAGFICIICAILLSGSSTILDMVYFAYSLRGSLFVILLMGIYWKKTSQKGAIIVMVLTGAAGLFWVCYKSVCGVYPIHPMFSETYIAVIVAFVSTVVCSLLFKDKGTEK